jgi:hypothetical protein
MKNQKSFTPIKNWLARHHPSAFLLAAQLLLLVLYAVYSDLPSQWGLLNAIGGLILVLVVWVVDRSPSINWIAWVLAIPAFLLSVLSAIIDNQTLLVWSSLLEAILYFYAAVSLIIYMLEDTMVTTDELFAAGATFTLLAWGFAYSYFVCQVLVPESFMVAGNLNKQLSFIELLSLSFTNLSATGLGDIVPVSAPARVLAMLEQFSGVGYLTIVVSRLIGLSISTQKRKKGY